MKAFLLHLALFSLVFLHPIYAEKVPSLEELQKQLSVAVNKEIAERTERNEDSTSLKSVADGLNSLPSGEIGDNELKQWQPHFLTGAIKPDVALLFNEFGKQARVAEKVRLQKLASELPAYLSKEIRRAMSVDDIDTIRGIYREIGNIKLKLKVLNPADPIVTDSTIYSIQTCLESMASFYEARQTGNTSGAQSHLGSINSSFRKIEDYIPAAEAREYQDKLRRSIGILPPAEYVAWITSSLDELLDDANQDKLAEIGGRISTTSKWVSGLPSTEYSTIAQRLQRLDSFAVAMQENVDRVKNGISPRFSFDTWTVTRVGSPALIKREDLVDRLRKYRVHISDENQGTSDARLYYGEQELREIADDLVVSLLDDSNQDRLSEMLANIRKYKKMSGDTGYSSGFNAVAQRFQQLEYLATNMAQAVERVKSGQMPQSSVDSWQRSDSSVLPLLKGNELIALLKKYRVKVPGKDGVFKEGRLYYDIEEMRKVADGLLARLLDDKSQESLDEIGEEIRRHRQFSSSYSSEFSTVSAQLQQIEQFARNLTQAVMRVKSGGAAQVNIDQWLQAGSEYKPLMDKKQMENALKAYRVKVKDHADAESEQPLYQKVDDIVARINKLDDIEKELRALTMISRSSSYDSGQANIGQGLSVLTGLAELHANLKKGNSFVLQNPQSPGVYDWSNRSGQTDPLAESLLAAKLESLRNEAERAVLQRMFAGEKIEESSNRDEMMNELLKKFIEAKNYQAVLMLGRLTAYFVPKRPLISFHELQAIQNFLDGVRQQEELGEPRLATGHYQRAAAARSTIIPVEELRKRLSQLKQEHPAAYEKGTEDALAPERSQALSAQPPLVVPAL